jgi:hypothetical protein
MAAFEEMKNHHRRNREEVRRFMSTVAVHLLFSIVIALVFGLVVAGLMGWRRRRDEAVRGASQGVLFAIIVVFLGAWVGGVWLAPFGPTLWGVAWLPFVLSGLFVALFMLAVTSPIRNIDPGRSIREGDLAAVPARVVVFSHFFWILLIALLAAAVAAYLS